MVKYTVVRKNYGKDVPHTEPSSLSINHYHKLIHLPVIKTFVGGKRDQTAHGIGFALRFETAPAPRSIPLKRKKEQNYNEIVKDLNTGNRLLQVVKRACVPSLTRNPPPPPPLPHHKPTHINNLPLPPLPQPKPVPIPIPSYKHTVKKQFNDYKIRYKWKKIFYWFCDLFLRIKGKN